MKTTQRLFLFLFLSAALLGGFTACGDDDPEPEPPVVNPNDNQEEPTDTTTTQKPDTTTVVGSPTAGWPAQYAGVMLQAFYWDGYGDSQWSELEAKADQLSGTFDLVWLPQSGNCGGKSMGYDDLYWFTNYNSSFGTEQQLRSLIRTFKDKDIKTIADVVINHRKNVSNWVDFPKETYKGVTYEMKSTDICKNDDGGATLTWATQNNFQLSSYNDTGEDWGGMRDLDHRSENVQTIVKAYLDFLINDLGYAGFRYDMVKGYSAKYTALYNAASQPEFSVGECWDGTNTIKNWIEGTAIDNIIQSAAFDFQFRYVVRNAMNGGNYARLSQQNDGNWPLMSNNYESGKYRRYAVTFVENHDTEYRSANAQQDPLRKDTLAANAYLLAMPGTPCVFLKHWQAYPSEIKAMVAARKTAGINNESNYASFRTSAAYAGNIIKTDGENRLLVVVGDVSANETNVNAQQWTKVTEGYHYAYYFPTTMETAYADLPTGHYEGQQSVRLSAVTATDGAQIVYTTDGSTPTVASTTVASGTQVTIPSGATTTLTVGMLIGGQVRGVVSRTYTVKVSEKDLPIEVPSFCTVSEGEVCAFFEAPSSWNETIYCWAWNDSPAENFTSATGTWPGVACTFLGNAANGNKVYKWSWDGTRQHNTAVSQPAKIIFSNEGNQSQQTNDLTFENGGYYNRDGLKGNVNK